MGDWGTLSGYYAYYALDSARYVSVSGDERRDSFDGQVAG